MDKNDLMFRLKQFMDNEARSCSMDYGCVTSLYVYRMWRGAVSLEEITAAMKLYTPLAGKAEWAGASATGLSACGAEGSVAR